MAGLASKEEREKWEREFADAFLGESVKVCNCTSSFRKVLFPDSHALNTIPQ